MRQIDIETVARAQRERTEQLMMLASEIASAATLEDAKRLAADAVAARHARTAKPPGIMCALGAAAHWLMERGGEQRELPTLMLPMVSYRSLMRAAVDVRLPLPAPGEPFAASGLRVIAVHGEIPLLLRSRSGNPWAVDEAPMTHGCTKCGHYWAIDHTPLVDECPWCTSTCLGWDTFTNWRQQSLQRQIAELAADVRTP